MGYLDGEKLDVLAKSTSSAEVGLKAGLCGRCSSATIRRRTGHMEVTVHCGATNKMVPSDIEECSAYTSPKAMSLYEMEQIALTVDGRAGVHDKSYL